MEEEKITTEEPQTPAALADRKQKKIKLQVPESWKKMFRKGISVKALKQQEIVPPTEEELKENILVVRRLKEYFPVETNLIGQPLRFLKR